LPLDTVFKGGCAMVTTSQLRKGLVLELEGAIYSIIWIQQQTSGPKAGVITKVKLRNVRTGNITEHTFKPTDKFNDVEIDRRKNQFLYADGEKYVFMDKETYEQLSVTKGQLGKGALFLKPDMEVDALYFKDEMMGVEMPPTIQMKIISTLPSVTNASGNVMKPAVLENKTEILVPQFLSSGETVIVDTHTGEYMERLHEPKKEHK